MAIQTPSEYIEPYRTCTQIVSL